MTYAFEKYFLDRGIFALTMGRRILLVDDEFQTRKIVRFNLEQAGFEVVVATDGLEAWNALHRVPIHLIVIDEIMPRLSGSGLCEMVRQERRLADIPLVMITAKEPPFDEETLESLGIAHCFRKPFSPLDLVEKVNELLDTPGVPA